MTGCEKVPIQKVWPTYTNETLGRKIGHFCTFLSIFLLSSGPVSQQHDMETACTSEQPRPFSSQSFPSKVVRRPEEIIFCREFHF